MIAWIFLLTISAILGTFIGLKFSGKVGLALSVIVPWLTLLLWLLLSEYVLPYRGGGASMWPIAQLIAGTVAAITGLISFVLTQKIKSKGI